ncbi:MAG: hypothetical protein ACI94Y_000661, partial [Maribacter sp.]
RSGRLAKPFFPKLKYHHGIVQMLLRVHILISSIL